MNLFRWFRRRSEIRKYSRVLGPKLRSRFGKRRTYSSTQVAALVKELKLSTEFIEYAIAMYCTKKEYASFSSSSNNMVQDYAISRAVAFNIAVAHIACKSDNNSTGSSDIGGDSDGGF